MGQVWTLHYFLHCLVQEIGKSSRILGPFQRKKETSGFRCKAHIGVEKYTRLIHMLKTTTNVHKTIMTPELLCSNESRVYGKNSYLGVVKAVLSIQTVLRVQIVIAQLLA